MNHQKKIGIVTGGSRGLGRNAALKMADRGIDLLVTWRKEREAAEEVVGKIESKGGRAVALALDVGDIGRLDEFVERVRSALRETWDRESFDFLVNNAGIIANEPIAETSEETFDRLLNVHFKGVFFLTQKLLPLQEDGGRIVNLSSGLARYSFPGYAAYGSMKGAVDVFTRYLALELGERKITANVVAPGATLTDMNRDRFEADPEMAEKIAGMAALGRIGEADDIGGVVAFLCTEEAGWINGQRIESNGGFAL
jgi:NAD(P)-dependent dehydrogenase (short-subunit alcohol dehydrogenase family)